MSAHTLGRRPPHGHEPGHRSLTPLLVVTGAALVFTILLILVRLQWRPLESVDHSAAARINALIAGHPALVSVVKAVTWLGSDGVLWTIIGVSAVFLAFRRRWRLVGLPPGHRRGRAGHGPDPEGPGRTAAPGGGAPHRARRREQLPQRPLARLDRLLRRGATWSSCPAVRGRWRTVFITVIVTLIALIGISRILLGVHYLSDVLGGWTLGITWLGLTAFAFELTRRAEGQPVTDPLAEGLEPEARTDLDLAQPETPMTKRSSAARSRARIAAGLVVAWVLILGVIVGIGELVVKYSHDKWLGDTAIPRWFAAHRTPTLNQWSNDVSVACATTGILIVAVAACVIFLAVIRHWRPVIFIVVVMFGELAAFLAAAAVVMRPRPYVHHLDQHLPTSAYPSGHVAATTCLYGAIAIVVLGHTRGWWRWLFVALAIAAPVAIALSRMYRGEHHPTDVLGSLIFAALWLTATTLLIKPNAELARAFAGNGGREAPLAVRAGGFAGLAPGSRTVTTFKEVFHDRF